MIKVIISKLEKNIGDSMILVLNLKKIDRNLETDLEAEAEPKAD